MKTESEDKPRRKPFHEEFSEKIIARLKEGTAPWQIPWEPDTGPDAPFNPVSGTVYKGINRINLSLSSFSDPRWMTLKQANDQGLRIMAGSKSTEVVFYQFLKEEDRLDDQGKPVVGEDGQPEKQQVRLERPIVRMAHVFNGEQIKDMPPLPPEKNFNWNPEEKAEKILSSSGAVIKHDQSNQAYYRPSTDEIHLPARSQFPTPANYYGTALHELGHWTSALGRLNRKLNGPLGSEDYAREELRAEIASWMLSQDVGISHNPDQHTSYVAAWIKALEENPLEIMRACSDAEKIKEYVMELEREHTLTKEVEAPAPELPERPAQEKTFLAVPYAEKDRAKAQGAKWDAQEKSWYAPAGADMAKLKAWLPEQQNKHRAAPEPAMAPEQEFAQAIAEAGLDLHGALPVMDGKIHRVPLLNGKTADLDGAYCGYADGRPAGWMQNFRTGEKQNWMATGHVLSPEQKARLQAEQAEHRAKREQELAAHHNERAIEAARIWDNCPAAGEEHAYLQKKGVPPLDLRQDEYGNLLLPVRNVTGEIRGLQSISPDGVKRFMPGMEKTGNFHLLSTKEDPAKFAKGEILLAEGYATGASLHLATGKPVAVAFDAGNLEAVAKALREKFPQAQLTICADNDQRGKVNIGVEKAKAAALAVGGAVKIPSFSREEVVKGFKDFNDLHQAHGLKAVAKEIGKGKEKAKGKTMEMER